MGIKIFLTIFISLCVSVSVLADNHENTATPAEEASIMPVMDEKPSDTMSMEKDLMFSGDFAGSYSMFSNKIDPHGGFDVNLAQFNLKASMGQSRLHFGFGYGSTVRDLNSAGANKLGLLNASYHMKTSYGLGFTLGRFESPVGHETYNHRMNSQFTRSYGFSLAPYFSTGVGFNYGQKMWNLGFLVTNGRGADTNMDDDLTMAVTVDIDPITGLHIDLNYVMGTESDGSQPRNSIEEEEDTTSTFTDLSSYSVAIIDASISYMINDMFNVAVNYISNTMTPSQSEDIGSTSLAAYINAKYSYFDFGLRYEQFSFDLAQKGNTMTGLLYNGSGIGLTGEGTDNSLRAITFAVKTNMDKNADILLEYRMNKADDKNTFANADAERTDSFDRITVALMYNF